MKRFAEKWCRLGLGTRRRCRRRNPQPGRPLRNARTGRLHLCRGELLEQRALLSVGVLPDSAPSQGPLDEDLRDAAEVAGAMWPATASEFLINGSFEAGDFTGWNVVTTGQGEVTPWSIGELTPWTVGPADGGYFFNSSPLDGEYSAYNGFDGRAGLHYELYQDVEIPENALSAKLTTNTRFVGTGAGVGDAVGRTLEISVRGSNNRLLETLSSHVYVSDGTGQTDDGWQTQVFELAQSAGLTVRVHFSESIPESFASPGLIEFDDISLVVQQGASAAEFTGSNPHGLFPGEVIEQAGDSGPRSMATADLNEDGRLDLVTADSARVSVLLGRGDGALPHRTRYYVGDQPVAVALGDVNGDGHVDLVAANYGSNDVAVLLGDGNGEFAAAQRYLVGHGPQSVVLADLHGNGHLDIATANLLGNDVSVLSGAGDGTFGEQQRFAVGNSPRSIAAADLDGNGRTDLVTANDGSDDISVLIGLADGTFAPQRTHQVGDRPHDVALAGSLLGDRQRIASLGGTHWAVDTADLNGDGHEDIVLGVGGWIGVLLGRGDGTFNSLPVQEAGTGWVRHMAVADLDGDGWLDVVTANSDGYVSVLWGLGDGTFEHPERYAVGYVANSVTLADLNDDGLVDIIAASFRGLGGGVSVLRGVRPRTFVDTQIHTPFGSAYSTAAADLDGDGRLEIIVGAESHYFYVLSGPGDGTFPNHTPYHRPPGASPEEWLMVDDLNGDSLPDAVTMHWSSDQVAILLNRHPDPLNWDGQGPGNWSDATRWVDEDDRPQAVAPSQFADVVVRTDTVTVDTAASAAWNLTVADGTLALTPGASLHLAGLQIRDAAELNIALDGPAGAALNVSGDVTLGGRLSFEVTAPLIEPGSTQWGLQTLAIVRADRYVRGDFLQEPAIGEHLGHGVFYRGTVREVDAVFAQLYQAAPGDTDGDGVIDNADLQRILAAGSFNQGPQGFGWTEGDFDGDGDVDNDDLQLILASGRFGAGRYAAIVS